jgi:hypothetical protein
MKKIFFIAAVIVFVGFVYFGFKTASTLFASRSDPLDTNIGTPQAHVLQSNYLLVLVNDLAEDSPQLIAVWAVLDYPSTPPQLVFLPLFPGIDTEINREFTSAFALSASSRLTKRSMGEIEKIADFDFEDYFVVDNAALLRFASYAEMETLEIFNLPAESPESITILQNNIGSFFTAFCRLSTTGASNAFFSQIEWNQLQPDHFSSGIRLDEALLLIENVNNVPALETCEVLSP